MVTDQQSTLMERLKRETSDLHSHAESRPLQRAIAKGVVDRSTFVAYLGQLRAVHGALEAALRKGSDSHPAVAALSTPERMRVPDLDLDLEFYGVDPSGLEPGEAARAFLAVIERVGASRPVALLGAQYVLEGSTNGGRFLAHVLHKSWNLDGQGVAYFDPYGDRQPAQWAAFRREMDAATFDRKSEDAIVEMAKTTFEAIAEISEEVAEAG